MNVVLLSFRLLLSAIFSVAGIAKLADRLGTRKAIEQFGSPDSLSGPLSLALPATELAIAVLLLPLSTAWWGACAALALLLIFVGVIGINMALGRTPDCHCFGQLHSEPVGWRTLLRNGLLTTAAGWVVWQGRENPGLSIIWWTQDLSVTDITVLITALLVVVVVAVEGWVALHLMRQNGRFLLRIDALEARLGGGPPPAQTSARQPQRGLPIGSSAPHFELASLSGSPVTLETLRALGKPVFLLFTDPHCGPCDALLPSIGRWHNDNRDKLTVAVVSRGKPELNRAKAEAHGLENFLLQNDREVAKQYQASGTPSAVLIDRNGAIASPVASGSSAIGELMALAISAVPEVGARQNNGAQAEDCWIGPHARPTIGA
jgi:methylamine dehydrogenase accessory protein MauD